MPIDLKPDPARLIDRLSWLMTQTPVQEIRVHPRTRVDLVKTRDERLGWTSNARTLLGLPLVEDFDAPEGALVARRAADGEHHDTVVRFGEGA